MADKPKNCLLCGAPASQYGVDWMTFECGSLFDTGFHQFVKIAEKCKDRQIAQLKARIAKLEQFIENEGDRLRSAAYHTYRRWKSGEDLAPDLMEEILYQSLGDWALAFKDLEVEDG